MALAWDVFSEEKYLMRMIGRIIAILAVITGTAAAAPLLSDAQTRTALAAMSRAGEDGLDPGAYSISAPSDPAARGAAISAVFLTYMRDVRIGRPVLRALDPDVVLPPSDFDAAAALNEAASNGKLDTLLASLAPPAPDYASLKAGLAHYRRIAAAGGWPFVHQVLSPGYSERVWPLKITSQACLTRKR